MNPEDLVKMLDSFMANGGSHVNPMDLKESTKTKILTSDVDGECVSCANIPNLPMEEDD